MDLFFLLHYSQLATWTNCGKNYDFSIFSQNLKILSHIRSVSFHLFLFKLTNYHRFFLIYYTRQKIQKKKKKIIKTFVFLDFRIIAGKKK